MVILKSLWTLALDVRGNNFAKVFTLSSGNIELFFCWLARTITVAAYPIILAYTHTWLGFENHYLRNGTSTICRTTHNFRVVEKSSMCETKWYINHSMMGKVCNGCKRCCFLAYNEQERNLLLFGNQLHPPKKPMLTSMLGSSREKGACKFAWQCTCSPQLASGIQKSIERDQYFERDTRVSA